MKQVYLTVREFAALHHVNRRTLHYYDSIGLFSPKKVGENRYRYYTYDQSGAFEIILALRELGMSIDEIRAYQQDRSPETMTELLAEKRRDIDRKIRRLTCLRDVLREKQEALELSCSDRLEEISVVDCPRELLRLADLSELTDGTEPDEAACAGLARFWTDPGTVRTINSGYGSVLPLERLLAGEYDRCRYLFVRLVEPVRAEDIFVKPAGQYLRGYCRGSWDHLPDIYRKMVTYAKNRGLTLTGPAYEEGLNGFSVPSGRLMEAYVTQISIPCTKM